MEPKLEYIESEVFGEYWLVIEKFYHGKFYNKDYPKFLASFLEKLNAVEVLDAACGMGFPSIDLAQFDFNLTCTDGDPSMVEIFKKRAEERNLDIPITSSKWSDLPNHFESKFDVVLCLDSSITYVDSWAKTGKLDIGLARESIRKSLQAFYRVLKPAGSAVIGLARYAFENNNAVEIDYGTMEIEGVPVHHQWIIDFDIETKRKTWKLVTRWDGKENIREYESYMLLPEELRELLSEAGFENIRTEEIVPNEYDYNFVAQKPK